MTRRQRLLNILDWHGYGTVSVTKRHYNQSYRLSWDDLTDEALETLTRRVLKDYQRQQKRDAENRAIFAANRDLMVSA